MEAGHEDDAEEILLDHIASFADHPQCLSEPDPSVKARRVG